MKLDFIFLLVRCEIFIFKYVTSRLLICSHLNTAAPIQHGKASSVSLTDFSPRNNHRGGLCSAQEHCVLLQFLPPCAEKSLVFLKIIIIIINSRRKQYTCIFFSIRRKDCSKGKISMCFPMPVACLDSISANVIVTNGKSPCAQCWALGNSRNLLSHSFNRKRTFTGQVGKGGLFMSLFFW